MSKRNLKYDYSLPKHQKKIVLCLARNEPMIMSETNRKIKGEATSTNRAFHELQKKEMITRTEAIEYHGRRFWKYWLSERGIAYALLNGSNPATLRNVALQVIENDAEKKILEMYLDLRSISQEIAVDLDRALLHVSNLDASELTIELIDKMSRAFFLMDEAEEKRFRSILGKSADFKKAWTDYLRKMEEFSKKERESLGVDD
jgi:predicted transcriptional regulator